MSEMVTLVLDNHSDDEYAYKHDGESEADYKARMDALHKNLLDQASDEEKQLAVDVLDHFAKSSIGE